MNSANTNPLHRNAAWRRLPVEWLERHGALPVVFLAQRKKWMPEKLAFARPPEPPRQRRDCISRSRPSRPTFRAFTILELLIVVGIIGFLAAMALPHMSGFTKSSSLTGATRQLLDEVAYARQLALIKHSEVDMVFLPTNFWVNGNCPSNAQLEGLVGHQGSAYALISARTVGDQPGQSHTNYLTDWKFLPQGIYFSLFELANPLATMNVSVTNTTTGLVNSWTVYPFKWGSFPFPSTKNNPNNIYTNQLPYIGFTATGQLTTNGDQFILLNNGSMFYPASPDGTLQLAVPNWVEAPVGNVTNNPNLIHIDALTARAKIEHNQF